MFNVEFHSPVRRKRQEDMSNEDAPVEELKNIGPKTADLLHQIGILTQKNLADTGPVLVYKILQHRFPESP